MKLIIFAFIISISIHLLLFNSYKNEKIEKQSISNSEKSVKKSDIKYVTIKKQEPKKEIKEVIKKVEKKIEKPKPIVKPKPKPTPKKYVKAKEIQKAKEFQKKVLKEQVVDEKPTIEEKTLEDFLSQKEPVDKKILNKLERLYGREYQNFTKVQKAYLEKNINNFQTITQRVLNRLGYPRIAAKLRLSGTNIVEFLFHPNGSISNLKIIDSSGYEVFDEYTLELIEIAYKDYPRPKTTTKLRFNVSYRLY
jgi:protein TonB